MRDKPFVAIPRHVFDALIKTKIPVEARQVLDVVIRETYGWSKEEECIGIRCFTSRTGIHRPNIYRAIDLLLDAKIIKCLPTETQGVKTYAIQEDVSKWEDVSGRRQCLPTETKASPHGDKKRLHTETKHRKICIEKNRNKDTGQKSSSGGSLPVKRGTKIPPDRKIKSTYDDFPGFIAFWEEYPRKVGKEKALKAWIKHKNAIPDDILAILTKHKEQDQWIKDGGEFIPHASTWLNGKRWEDEIKTEQDRREDAKRRFLAKYD